jgi:hypothetical protein
MVRVPSLSPWARLVGLCAVLVVGGGAALGAGALASSTDREVVFVVRGALDRLVADLGDADAELVRGGSRLSVEVRRFEHYTFGHAPVLERSVEDGTLRLRAHCPHSVPRSCSVRLRVIVPDNLPVEVRSRDGDLTVRGLRGSLRAVTRGGDLRVRAFCGFLLRGETDGGDLDVGVACPPQQLTLASGTGDVHAVLPRARYRLDASSATGDHAVRGLENATDAAFAVRALSGSGDVLVEAAR